MTNLAYWQGTVVLCVGCWNWQESQPGKGKAPVCLADEEMYEERRVTEPGYSAHPGCWTHLMCSRRDSEHPLYLWAGHQWTLTGPENIQ